jgi:DNA-directed RNA polymerase beta subunit
MQHDTTQSNKCHLDGMSPAELVKAREEGTELGGYFIINGLEKLIRLICMPKRNFVRRSSVPLHSGMPHSLAPPALR